MKGPLRKAKSLFRQLTHAVSAEAPVWPDDIIIEPTNRCNLACPVCPTFLDMRRPKGMMSVDTFRRIIDDIAGKIPRIAMNFAGEPTLNKDLWRFVAYARRRGVESLVSTNTTLLHTQLAAVLDSGLQRLIVCLDGATAEVHQRYRRNSDFTRIRDAIAALCREKARRRLARPHVNLQFVVMAQNEHQIEAVTQMAKELGVDSLSLKTMSLGSLEESVEKHLALARTWLPAEDRYRRYRVTPHGVTLKQPLRHCPLHRSAVILWNGDMTICCYDFNGEHVFGNVLRDGGFSRLYQQAEWKRVQERMRNRQLPLCRRCNLTALRGQTIDIGPAHETALRP